MKMIIDASGYVLGRLASHVAKQALLGNRVIVVNAEKAVVSGKREEVLQRHLDKLDVRNKGNIRKGPFHQRRPDRFVRKTIRGMLPWKSPRGREAYKNVMVYVDTPAEEIKRRHGIDVSKEKPARPADIKQDVDKYVTVAEICGFIGGTW